MNTETGSTYRLGAEMREMLDRPFDSEAERRGALASAAQSPEERRAFAELVKAGGQLVAVSDRVAHAQRLGQREQERRKARRKADRAQRKRNR